MDMLSYSKEREPAIEPTDLNEVAGEVVELMKPRAAELNVAFDDQFAADLPITPVDPEAIHRALLNIVGNALDAVEDRPDAAVEVATTLEPDGEWVRIAVATTASASRPTSWTTSSSRSFDQGCPRHRPGPGRQPQDPARARRRSHGGERSRRRHVVYDAAAGEVRTHGRSAFPARNARGGLISCASGFAHQARPEPRTVPNPSDCSRFYSAHVFRPRQ